MATGPVAIGEAQFDIAEVSGPVTIGEIQIDIAEVTLRERKSTTIADVDDPQWLLESSPKSRPSVKSTKERQNLQSTKDSEPLADRSPSTNSTKERQILHSTKDLEPLTDSMSSKSEKERQSLQSTKDLEPLADRTWDFFLSHKQSNAQDTVGNLRMFLSERMPHATFWLDIEQNPTEKGMEHGVKNCKNFLLYLTEGITSSSYVVKEISWAIAYGCNIILVGETDERHGKPSIEKLIKECPEDLKNVFAEYVIIPWHRDPEFRAVCLDKIMQASAKEQVVPAAQAKRHNSKPLMFSQPSSSYEDPSEASSDSEKLQVFDWTFVYFTAACGVALPGASWKVRYWSVAVQAILLTCGLMCFSRLFTTEGPAFFDHGTIIQIVAAHPMVFFFLFIALRTLRGPIVADMLHNHIDSVGEDSMLRLKTKVFTAMGALLTAVLSVWGWCSYLPGFFAPYYMEKLGEGRPLMLLFGLAHGFTWILILPLFFGGLFAALLIMFTLQELSFMCVLTAFKQLHPGIAKIGLRASVEKISPLHLQEVDVSRFQVAFLEKWSIYKKIHLLASAPFLLCWLVQIGLLAWSIPSIIRGFEASDNDPRVERLRENWSLTSRVLWFAVGSPWFGAGQWIVCVLPWGVAFYPWHMNRMVRRLVFTNPCVKQALKAFIGDLDLNFRVLFLPTTLRTLPLYALVLATNTVGFNAEVVRTLRELFA